MNRQTLAGSSITRFHKTFDSFFTLATPKTVRSLWQMWAASGAANWGVGWQISEIPGQQTEHSRAGCSVFRADVAAGNPFRDKSRTYIVLRKENQSQSLEDPIRVAESHSISKYSCEDRAGQLELRLLFSVRVDLSASVVYGR